MPHLVIEYSRDLEAPFKQANLLVKLREQVVASDLFSPEAVKARSIAYDEVALPEGANGFVHVTCNILTDRSLEQRGALSDALFTCAKASLPEGVKLSVDIHEMCKQTYQK